VTLRTPRPVWIAALVAALAAATLAQSPATAIDAGHSYASFWMGRESEVSVMVNTGVAQAGGSIALSASDPAASSLEVHIVPGGEGARLMAPDGSLQTGIFANLVRYTVLSYRSARAAVGRDGLLEFTGDLTVWHVTREATRDGWNWNYSGPTYTDPRTETWSRTATFVLTTPRAEFLESFLQKKSELLVSSFIVDADFPELPGALLDAYWPLVAQDEQCSPAADGGQAARFPGGTVCTGHVISVTPTYYRAQTAGRDYSGLRRYDAPVRGPVTIGLHLRLASPGRASSDPPGK